MPEHWAADFAPLEGQSGGLPAALHFEYHNSPPLAARLASVSARANTRDGRAPRLSCRQIRPSDLLAVVDLLCEGFPSRRRAYWWDGLQRLAAHVLPDGVPRFGYVLVSGEVIVGVLLLIHSTRLGDAEIRCNVSSWYVRPRYHAYATLLNLHAIRNHRVTYVNISPAQNTLATLDAWSFTRGTVGCFVGMPALSRIRRGVTAILVSDPWPRSALMSAADARLLDDHLRFGCIPLWVETENRGFLFIFRKRTLRFGRLPCAMLVYCPSIDDLERFAGVIGRRLAARGLPLMLAGTERPLRGILGKHFPAKMPIYYKGCVRPRSSDLSYTEAAMFGI